MRGLNLMLLAVLALPVSGCLRGSGQTTSPPVATDTLTRKSLADLQRQIDSLRQVDSALRNDIGMIRGEMQALRTELQSLRTESGSKITAMEDGLKFDVPVTFAFNDATVRQQDFTSLTRFAHVVAKYYPTSHITVLGYADRAGTSAANQRISLRRARAVVEYLVSQAGLDRSRLTAAGVGAIREITPGATRNKPGAEENRRVVFIIESAGNASVGLGLPDAEIRRHAR